MEKLKLRSSGVENVCVLIDFIYENDLVALGVENVYVLIVLLCVAGYFVFPSKAS